MMKSHIKKLYIAVLVCILSASSVFAGLVGIIDPQLDRGTATNQVISWNETSKRYISKTSGNAIYVFPGDDIQVLYDWLKSVDRDSDMGVASEFNRRTLLILPGLYQLPSTWVLDSNYVDISGMSGDRNDVIIEGPSESTAVRQDLSGLVLSNFTIKGNSDGLSGGYGFRQRQFNSTSAITTDLGSNYFKITATGIGKGVLHSDVEGSVYTGNKTTTGGLGDFIKVEDTDSDGYYELQWRATDRDDDNIVILAPGMNETTDVTVYMGAGTNRYYGMHFTAGQASSNNQSCRAEYIYSGNFYNCTGDGFAFRNGTMEAYANHYDCHAGFSGFYGDTGGPVRGESISCTAGDNSFVGCVAFGIPIGEEALFMNCSAGVRSFGIGALNEGTFIGCRGGDNSFAGNTTALGVAIFAGTAIDCVVNGVGGFTANAGSGSTVAQVTGTIKGCRIPSIINPINLAGALIEDSYVKSTVNGQLVFQLDDDNSAIYNSTLVPSNNASSIGVGTDVNPNIRITHCRMTGTGTGLALFVTNLIATPYNVVDTDIK